MNKVILTGNLTRDPELSTTNSGVSVCRFSIAVQRNFQNSEGEREADFFNVTVWRNRAENCHKKKKKGSKSLVIGRLQNSTYEANDGSKRYVTDIVAEDVEFLVSRPSEGGDIPPRETSAPKKTTSELEPIDDDDSLPF